jgi:hypothetical protein
MRFPLIFALYADFPDGRLALVFAFDTVLSLADR